MTGFNSVPLGTAGTGSAFVLNQNIATGPLRMLLNDEQVSRAAAAAALKRKQLEAKDEAARLAKMLESSPDAAPYYQPEMKKQYDAFLGQVQASQAAGTYAQDYPRLLAEKNRLDYVGKATKSVNEGLGKLTTEFGQNPIYRSDALSTAQQMLLYDDQHNPLSPDKVDLRKLNQYDPRLLDREKAALQLTDSLPKWHAELLSGGGPGGTRTKTSLEGNFEPLRDKQGNIVTDHATHQPLLDTAHPKTQNAININPAYKAVVDDVQRELTEKWQQGVVNKVPGTPATAPSREDAINTWLAAYGYRSGSIDVQDVPEHKDSQPKPTDSTVFAVPTSTSFSAVTPGTTALNRAPGLNDQAAGAPFFPAHTVNLGDAAGPNYIHSVGRQLATPGKGAPERTGVNLPSQTQIRGKDGKFRAMTAEERKDGTQQRMLLPFRGLFPVDKAGNLIGSPEDYANGDRQAAIIDAMHGHPGAYLRVGYMGTMLDKSKRSGDLSNEKPISYKGPGTLVFTPEEYERRKALGDKVITRVTPVYAPSSEEVVQVYTPATEDIDADIMVAGHASGLNLRQFTPEEMALAAEAAKSGYRTMSPYGVITPTGTAPAAPAAQKKQQATPGYLPPGFGKPATKSAASAAPAAAATRSDSLPQDQQEGYSKWLNNQMDGIADGWASLDTSPGVWNSKRYDFAKLWQSNPGYVLPKTADRKLDWSALPKQFNLGGGGKIKSYTK